MTEQDDAETTALIAAWRALVISDAGWVLFENGTGLLVTEPMDDPRAWAIETMREWGPVQAGTPSGDFNVITLDNGSGWAVTGHHDLMMTFVPKDEFDGEAPSDLVIGVRGRSLRAQDAATLNVIHVEPRRD